MRFPRSLAGCFVFVSGFTVACGQDLPDAPPVFGGTLVFLDVETIDSVAPRLLPAEPELGPIVPLGDTYRLRHGKRGLNRGVDNLGFDRRNLGFDRRNGVSPVAYSEDEDEQVLDYALRFSNDPDHGSNPNQKPRIILGKERQYPPSVDDSPNPLVNFFPIRVIGQPMPAPTGEPYGFGVPPVVPPVHPDEIQSHLSAAAAQLAMAGLNVEAQRIQEFQQHFQREHSQRLLITFKEFQLKVLQEEIAILKQGPPEPSPYIDVIIEAKAIGVK